MRERLVESCPVGCGCSRCRTISFDLGERYVDDEDTKLSLPFLRFSIGGVGSGSWLSYSSFGQAPVTAGLTPAQIQLAVAQNGVQAQRLGWDALYDAIASWILGFRNMTPAPAAFAQAVANW